jgi:carbon storage regulator CsrA
MDNSYLVLTRKSGDSLTLEVPQADGTVTTIHIDWLDNKRIGVEAPRNVSIVRHELTEKAKSEVA